MQVRYSSFGRHDQGQAKTGAHTQSNALAKSNNDTTGNEDANIVHRSKRLHESSDDGHEAANSHPPSSPEPIRLQNC